MPRVANWRRDERQTQRTLKASSLLVFGLWSLLFAVCCLLFAVCCLLFAVCCLLFAVRYHEN